MTRRRCGGFALALRYNHIISDGMSIIQFMIAVGEMAQGASAPSIPPVWQRELLNARNPPQVTFTHHEFDKVVESKVFASPFMTWPAIVSSLVQLRYLQFEKNSLITYINLPRSRY